MGSRYIVDCGIKQVADIAAAMSYRGLGEDVDNGLHERRRSPELFRELRIIADILRGIGDREAIAIEVALEGAVQHLAEDTRIAGAVEHHLVEIGPVDVGGARRGESFGDEA